MNWPFIQFFKKLEDFGPQDFVYNSIVKYSYTYTYTQIALRELSLNVTHKMELS